MENINIDFFLKENDDMGATTLSLEELKMFTFTNEIIQTADAELYYKTKYNIKQLNHILHYYGIQKSKMNKDEMVQVILFFETDPSNKETVQRRLRLWQNMAELKNDVYFSKYILF